jgi:hypothetical protein
MKRITRASLPDSFTYNGRTYIRNTEETKFWEVSKSPQHPRAVLVIVQAKRLRGVESLFGRVYPAQEYIFTPEITTYEVVKVMRKSCRRKKLRTGLTREDALMVVNSYPSSNRSMVVMFPE